MTCLDTRVKYAACSLSPSLFLFRASARSFFASVSTGCNVSITGKFAVYSGNRVNRTIVPRIFLEKWKVAIFTRRKQSCEKVYSLGEVNDSIDS